MNKLLVAGIAGVVAAGAGPYALEQWQARRIERQRQAQLERIDREIACLERLVSAPPPASLVEREIARCKALAADPPD